MSTRSFTRSRAADSLKISQRRTFHTTPPSPFSPASPGGRRRLSARRRTSPGRIGPPRPAPAFVVTRFGEAEGREQHAPPVLSRAVPDDDADRPVLAGRKRAATPGRLGEGKRSDLHAHLVRVFPLGQGPPGRVQQAGLLVPSPSAPSGPCLPAAARRPSPGAPRPGLRAWRPGLPARRSGPRRAGAASCRGSAPTGCSEKRRGPPLQEAPRTPPAAATSNAPAASRIARLVLHRDFLPRSGGAGLTAAPPCGAADSSEPPFPGARPAPGRCRSPLLPPSESARRRTAWSG